MNDQNSTYDVHLKTRLRYDRESMGGGLGVLGRHRRWQLDLDSMTYEQLLALGDKIGCVKTGLTNNEIDRSISKFKLPKKKYALQYLFPSRKNDIDKCSICLEEYGKEDEVGGLKCGHGYHFVCIKQWLLIKNMCPICRNEAVDRSNKPR